jgi:ribosomal protein L31
MKPMKSLFFTFLMMLLVPSIMAQSIIRSKGISKTDIDLTNETTLAQLTIYPSQPGKVIVRFDGTVSSTPGDRIVLAASDEPEWKVNDGNVSSEAVNSDVDNNSFSHSRVYNVNSGSHTFYAVAQNYVETEGDGIASIYGNLTVEFIPDNKGIIKSQGISKTDIDLTNETTLSQITINPSKSGKAIVRFDGNVSSTPGDRIVLAASDEPEWKVNDGNVSSEAVNSDVDNNSFSHSRVYNVNSGSHTFYAVAQNYVETEGDGIASIYGNLTVKFIPGTTTGKPEEAANSNLKVFPNPVQNHLTIQCRKTDMRSLTYRIESLTGKLIKNGNVSGTETLDVSNLSPGVYLLKMQGEDVLRTKKVVVE